MSLPSPPVLLLRLRTLLRRPLPTPAARVLVDAWSGAEVAPGHALPEPYGPGHVVYIGLAHDADGAPVGAIVRDHAGGGIRTVTLVRLGLRWAGGHPSPGTAASSS